MLQVDVRALKETLRDGIHSLHLPPASPATLPASSEVSNLIIYIFTELLLPTCWMHACIP